MGKKNRRHKQTKPKHEIDQQQACEGKCCHDGLSFSNLNNVIPHADLSCCQECSNLSIESKNDHSIEPSKTKDHLSLADGNSDITLSTTDEEEKPGLCVCLRCGFIACSRQSPNQHALKHYKAKNSHPVVVNLSNWIVWCYKCDNEIEHEEHKSETKQCLSLLRKALGKKTSKHDKQQFPTKSIGANTDSTTHESIFIKGLTNLGNTCFFNSVMQNLCQTRLLHLTMEHLLLGDFDYNVQPSKQDKNQEPLIVLIMANKQGPLTIALAKFLQDMASDSKKRVVNPGNLFSEICKKAPRFKGFRQQDSQELLRYLLDSVRTEEIKIVKRGILDSFGLKTGVTKDDIAKKATDSEEHEKIRFYGKCAGAPVIDTLFGGQLVSLVECLTCRKVSKIMESFFDLSLSLAANKPNLNCNQYSKKKQEPINVSKKKQEPINVPKNNKSTETKVESSAQHHLPSKHQKKKKAKERKKEMNKRRHHNSSSSKSEIKLNDDDGTTTLNDSDVEHVTENDFEVLENSVSNTTVNDNGATVLNSEGNSEENSCAEINGGILVEQDSSGELKENMGTRGSCGDIKDTSESVVEQDGSDELKENEGTRGSPQDTTESVVEQDGSDELKENMGTRGSCGDIKDTSESVVEQDGSDELKENEGTGGSPQDTSESVVEQDGSDELKENEGTRGSPQDTSESVVEQDVSCELKENVGTSGSCGDIKDTSESVVEQDGFGELKENMGTRGSCGDIKDTSGSVVEQDDSSELKENEGTRGSPQDTTESANEGRKDISDVDDKAGCGVQELGEPEDMEELRDTTTERENMVCLNKSVENEKVVETNSMKESEDTESSGSDNVELSKSCVECHGGVCDKVDNIVMLKNCQEKEKEKEEREKEREKEEREKEKQREKEEGIVCQATNKETHEAVCNPDDGTEKNESEEKREDTNTTLCSSETKDHKNEVATKDRESSIGITRDGCAEMLMQNNAGNDSFINITKNNSSLLLSNESNPIVPNDIVSGDTGSSNIPDTVIKIHNNDSVGHTINELNSNHNDFVSFSSNINAAVKSDDDDETMVKYNIIGPSTENSDNISDDHPSSGTPSNECTSKITDVGGNVINPCTPLDPSHKDTTENQEAGLSNELDSLFNINVSDDTSGKSNHLDVIIRDPSAKDNGHSNVTPVMSDKCESSLQQDPLSYDDNKTVGEFDGKNEPSNEADIGDLSAKDNGHSTLTPVMSDKCESSLQQDPLSYDNKKVDECENEPSNEADGLINGYSNEGMGTLQDENSHAGGTNVCPKDEAESIKSPIDSSDISRHHSLGDMRSLNANTTSVEGCLYKFCSPEVLDGNNKFICEECNKRKTSNDENEESEDNDDVVEEKDTSKKSNKRKLVYTEAMKQLLIYQPPPILTLHLKRFHQVGFSLKKLAKHVDFPLTLDLSPFCHKSSKVATDYEGNVLYSLSGVVEHSGSLHSGHYTAYCRVAKPSQFLQTKFETLTQLLNVMQNMWTKNDEHGGARTHEQPHKARWFHISDSHVSEVSEPTVLKAQAYLLFYERMVLIEDTE